MTHEEDPQPPDGGPQPAAYALRGTLSLGAGWSEKELRSAVDDFLLGLTLSLRGHGCNLIGHIKGILEAGEKGHLFFSVTSFEQPTRFKGALAGSCQKIDLTLNVIVYGVGRERIERLVLTGLREHLGEVLHDRK
jgi:hypothetical protein